MKSKKCCKLFLRDWHYSKLSFFHHDWRAFTYTPWLPYTWFFQIVYVAYRWLIALYFINWLITSGVSFGGPTYLIFLTNWAFLAFNCYLIVAALAVTIKYTSVHFINKLDSKELTHVRCIREAPPAGCCGYASNTISWYQMVQWLCYVIGNEGAVNVSILYWALLYRGGAVSGINANTHLVNGILALLDAWICGIPTNTLHVVYNMAFGAIYVFFTGMYFLGSGNIVYNALDYGEKLGLAIATGCVVVLVFIPAIHFIIFYFQSKLQQFILYCIFKRKEKIQSVELQEKDKDIEAQ